MEDLILTQVVPIQVVPSNDIQSPTQPPLVLIVDDERIIADTIGAILARAGYRTLSAYGGKTGLQLALAHGPDLLITDVFMPDLDGPSLALQVAESVPQCRILMVSGHAALNDLAAPGPVRVDFRLLAKPIHPTVLLREIEETLNLAESDGAVPAGPAHLTELSQIA